MNTPQDYEYVYKINEDNNVNGPVKHVYVCMYLLYLVSG